jgi:hypothetical protein
MTDRREFNLVFCPNDPNPKLKELVRIMAFSGQEIITITLVGPYCYDARIVFSRLDRTRGAQMRCVKMIAQPDLMRHYIFMDVRASEVSLFNTMRYYERIPADFIPLITEYCDTCRKHFVHTNCA